MREELLRDADDRLVDVAEDDLLHGGVLEHLADDAAVAAEYVLGLLTPAEVAAAIAYLLGADAAAVTGADLAVDGGLAI